MKNLLKSLALVAVSALAVVSCQKDELASQNDGEGVFFSLRTGDAGKTYIEYNGKSYTPKWTKGDQVKVFFGDPNDKDNKTPYGPLTNKSEDPSEADFQGTITGAPAGGYLYAFYPAGSFVNVYTDNSVGLKLPAEQQPTATSFDPKADILVSQKTEFLQEEGEWVAYPQFARVPAVLKINVFSSSFTAVQGDVLSKFAVESSSNELAGNLAVDLVNGWGKVAKVNGPSKSVSAAYDAERYVSVGSANDSEGCSVFLMVNAGELAAGSTLTFTGVGETYNIKKVINIDDVVKKTGKPFVLTPGKLTEINLSLAEENCEKKEDVDYSGNWMIVSKNVKDDVTTHYAMPAYTSGNNIKAVTYTLTAEGKAKSTETDLNDCLYVVEKVTEGTYKGYYTIQDANGLYLYAAGSSDSNYLKGNATLQDDAKYYWDITCPEEGVYSIVAKSSNNNVLSFNSTNNPPIFSCYATG